MKTTSDGRRPQNIKSGISQQALIGSSSNFKLKLRGPNQIKSGLEFEMKTTSDRPVMEEDLKILKVVYLSKHYLDFPKISKLSLGTKPK